MARVTVEDCLAKQNNRFALVVLAAERARQLSKGAKPMIDCENKAAVTALREIAAGKVRFRENVREIVENYLSEIHNFTVKPKKPINPDAPIPS